MLLIVLLFKTICNFTQNMVATALALVVPFICFNCHVLFDCIDPLNNINSNR